MCRDSDSVLKGRAWRLLPSVQNVGATVSTQRMPGRVGSHDHDNCAPKLPSAEDPTLRNRGPDEGFFIGNSIEMLSRNAKGVLKLRGE